MNKIVQTCLLTLLALTFGQPGNAIALSPKPPGGDTSKIHLTFRKVNSITVSGLANQENPPEYVVTGLASSALATDGPTEGQLVPIGKRIKVTVRGKQPQAKNCLEMAEKKFNNNSFQAVLGLRGTIKFSNLKIDYDNDEVKEVYVELADVLGCALVQR